MNRDLDSKFSQLAHELSFMPENFDSNNAFMRRSEPLWFCLDDFQDPNEFEKLSSYLKEMFGGMKGFEVDGKFIDAFSVAWINIPSKDCNPDWNKGFFQAVAYSLSQPL